MEPLRRFGFFRDQLAEMANGPYTLFADAQATIAALQADNRTYINERHENMKQIEQLQATNNRLGVRVETLEAQLTQRTTELEAAKRRVAAYDRWLSAGVYYTNAEFEEQINVRVNQRNALTDLKQQVAQLREDLANEKTAYKKLSEQWNELDVELTTLRGLVEKLDKMTPKRPTAISVEQAWIILDYIQDALLPAYRATLPREGATSDGGEHE